ncbi:MAG: GNAT family N-acetyltransferase [Sedimentisphaerales bacterium]|nr:GNAT family N-acetyltransferase [Sedimentisphaerales bacterium]
MITIRAITNLEEFETLMSYWQSWQNNPNSDFGLFQLVCRLRREVISPYVIAVELSGQPCALLVGRLERIGFAPRVGYFKPVMIPAKILTIIYTGWLGQVDEDIAKALFRFLSSVLVSGVADAVAFDQLPDNSPLLNTLMAHGSRLLCQKKLSWSLHWKMSLPEEGGFLDYKLKAKHRSWIRRKYRELESAFPGKVSWQWMSHFADVPALCAKLEGVAALTYQRALGAGFVDNEEHRHRFSLFSDHGQLRVLTLDIEGYTRAFWIGEVYQGVFYSSETGYDPELRDYEPGNLLFVKMADELMREGIREFDFGLGDAFYKKRFGDQYWKEATVWHFAPTVKGLALRSYQWIFVTLDTVGRSVLQKLGGIDKLKTRWRRHLVVSSKPKYDEK